MLGKLTKIENGKEAGIAYLTTLFLLTLLTAMGLTFLHKARMEMAITSTRAQGMQAEYLAEAATNHAMWRILNMSSSQGDLQVSHVNDNGEEQADGGITTGIDLQDLVLGNENYVGLRFSNVQIPQGTDIASGYVEFTSSSLQEDTTSLTIYGENSDDALPFNTDSFNISSRPATSSSIPWDNLPIWDNQELHRTPDLTSIIQEIVDRPGWSSGNAMVIVFRSEPPYGDRLAYGFGQSPAEAARLYVDYGNVAAQNIYNMHSLGEGRYGYKIRYHTDTTFATIAAVGAVGDHVTHQSYVLHLVQSPQMSCNAEYIETYELFSPTVALSWAVADLSEDPFNVPAHAVLEVAIINRSFISDNWAGVRAVGSTLDRRFVLHEAESGGWDVMVMHVQTDANSQIEYYAQNTGSIDLILLGYWTCGNYIETFVDFQAGGSNSWLNHSLAPYGVGPRQMAELVITNTSDSSDGIGGARKMGSVLNRTLGIHEAEAGGVDTASMFVTASMDDNAAIEIWSSDTSNIRFYLVGYWSTAPGTYTELSDTLGSPLVDKNWEDKDLSGFGVPGEAVTQIAMRNLYISAENLMGLREQESSLQRVIDLHEAEDESPYGSDIATIHVNADENSTIEWYHEDVSESHEYRLLGYWECMDTSHLDLMGHWKLNEYSGGEALDSSSNGNDGTLIDMDPVTDWVSGKIDGALEFDGGNDHVLVPHDSSLSLINQFTVAAWIYAHSGGLVSYDSVLCKGTSWNTQNYRFGTVGDEISFGFISGGVQEFNTSAANLQTETWYHIAATFNNVNDGVRVYLNGLEVGNWSTTFQPLANSEGLYIGRSQDGEYFDGKLDDIRIYNRVLDQTEIQVLYDMGT